jgi:spore coat polysaccharide biosynthesis protein SpsF
MKINDKNFKVGAIIQARTGSTRLPNKIFAKIIEKPLLWHIYNRISYSKLIDNIIIATTDKNEDNIIEEWANENNILIYRGSENDVLSRFYNAAVENAIDIIVRITADDPFKDPTLIDEAISELVNKNLNFVYNNKPPTFPEGLDVEIFDFNSLKKANNKSTSLFEREHVTQYFFNNLDEFKHLNITSIHNNALLRWTIDTASDLEMTEVVYENLYKENQIFLYEDILNLIKQKPQIAKININIERSEMYKNL